MDRYQCRNPVGKQLLILKVETDMKNRYIMGMLALVGMLTTGCMSYEKRVMECDSVSDFHDGYALCIQDGEYFFIDKDGTRTSKKYDKAWDFHNGYSVVVKYYEGGNESYIFLDKDCKEKHYPISGVFGPVNRWGNVWVKTRGGWALLNVESGSFHTPLFEQVDCVEEEGVAVVSNFKEEQGWIYYYEYAMCDGQGNMIVPLGKYTFIGNFHNGRALYSTTGYLSFLQSYSTDKPRVTSVVRKKGSIGTKRPLVGYIDITGKPVTPEQYTRADTFNTAGYAKVSWGMWYNPEEGIIDRYGKLLDGVALAVAEASYLTDGIWAVGKDEAGNFILASKEGKITPMDKGVKIARNERYYLTKNGRRYTLYHLGNDSKLVELCQVVGTGDRKEVVTIEENRDGDCLCFYNGHQRDEFNLRGERLETTQTVFTPYDVRGDLKLGFLSKAFVFK